ncbi:hypothetical protein AML91_21625 [Paenibacillus jilunlii]|uniref:Uncharacterized protein n=1 Tax=Paenibacillus jilunlii TaxID=682956 RepID=A0ABR5SPB4_9BACL|nr:hypothetical protein AML91_21625 [Paenibacillus jilunlii]
MADLRGNADGRFCARQRRQAVLRGNADRRFCVARRRAVLRGNADGRFCVRQPQTGGSSTPPTPFPFLAVALGPSQIERYLCANCAFYNYSEQMSSKMSNKCISYN